MSRTHHRYTSPKSVLYIGPDVHESDPPEIRERAVRRRLVVTTGKCPCGVRLSDGFTRIDRFGVTHLTIEHEPGCAAIEVGR